MHEDNDAERRLNVSESRGVAAIRPPATPTYSRSGPSADAPGSPPTSDIRGASANSGSLQELDNSPAGWGRAGRFRNEMASPFHSR